MAEISLEFIGTQLRRLQIEMDELRGAVERVRREGYSNYTVLAEHVDKIMADTKGVVRTRLEAFDQRFTYLDEAIENLRQDMSTKLDETIGQVRQEMNAKFEEMNAKFDELKALILAGRT